VAAALTVAAWRQRRGGAGDISGGGKKISVRENSNKSGGENNGASIGNVAHGWRQRRSANARGGMALG